MKPRLSIFTAPMTVTILLAACSGPGGSGGSGGLNTAGVSTAGSGGLGSTAGISAGGSGGLGTAGASGRGPTAGASGGGGSGVAATFQTVKTVINEAPCFGAGCHNDDQNPLNLRLDEQLHMRLTSRMSKNCGDIPVVNPGKPQESALVKILKGPCGPTPRMPLGCVDDQDSTCIPADYIAAIEQWIASGAPQP